MHFALGWYAGTVKQYIKDSDTVVVEFDTEVGVTYNYCIEKEARAGKIKLALTTEKRLGSYEQICQIGAVVEVKVPAQGILGHFLSAIFPAK